MYRLRFLKTMTLAWLFKARGLLDSFELNFWVVPFIDTDFSRLFTQTYSIYMALGRWHFIFNSVFRNVALKKAWVPVTTAETITYKKSIKAFSRVRLKTQLLCWDENRFYLEQSFYVADQLCAHALLEGLIRGPKGILKPNEVFQHLGLEQQSPEFPAQVQKWILSMEK